MKISAYILSFLLLNLHPTITQERVEQATEEVSISIFISQQNEFRVSSVSKSTPCTHQIAKNDNSLLDSKRFIHSRTPLYLRHRILLI